jgi:hypothetical protein
VRPVATASWRLPISVARSTRRRARSVNEGISDFMRLYIALPLSRGESWMVPVHTLQKSFNLQTITSG